MPNIVFIFLILFYSFSLAPLWACFRQILGNISQAVSLSLDVLQILFKLHELFLLSFSCSKKYLELPVQHWALHIAPENLKTCSCLIQHAVILFHVCVPFCSVQDMIWRQILHYIKHTEQDVNVKQKKDNKVQEKMNSVQERLGKERK